MEQNRISSSSSQAALEARSARGATGKAGVSQDGQSAPAQGDGFALLLAALGAGEGGVPGLDALPAAVDEVLQSGNGLPDAHALAAWAAGLQPGTALMQTAGPVMAGEVDALASRLGLGLLRAGQDTLVGQTALLDGAAELASLQGTQQSAVGGAAAGRGSAALRAQGAALQAAAQEAATSAADALRTGAQAARAVQQQGTEAVSHLRSQVAQAIGSAVGERRDAVHAAGTFLPSQPGEWMAAQQAPQAMAGSGPFATTGGTGSAAGLRSGEPAGGSIGVEPSLPAAPEPDLGSPDAAQAGMAGAEEQLADQLAEQVAYWVHQKTQSAELTLDRDGRPVEVKVALTGDEAHVTFRSDQAEARHLLDTSTAQLRDMLQREGLQLAGVTVDTAGGGSTDREGGREGARQGARNATVQAAAPAGASAGAGGVTERSVDIFV